MFDTLAHSVNNDTFLVRLGCRMTATFLVQVGTREFFVTVDRGRISAIDEGQFRMRGWSFAVRATEEVWRTFWLACPPPGYHDIFAMSRFGHCRLEGDLSVLLSNLRYVKEVLAIPRRKADTGGGDG